MSVNTRLLKGNPTYYINSVIVILLMFGFRFIPAFGGITEVGMGCLGVFIGTIWGWLTVGMLWPSLLGLIAFGLTGYITVDQALTSGFGSNNVLVLVMIFGLLGVMETSGIANWLSLKIINLPIAKGRPWVLVFLLLFASYILVALTCSWGSAMLVWVVFYHIVELNGIEKGKYTSFVIASIIGTAILGGQLFPFSVPVVLLTGAFTGVAGAEAAPGFLPYVTWMFVISLVIMLVWMLVAKFVYKVRAPKINLDGLEKAGRLDTYQKITLVFLGLFVLCLVLAGILPKDLILTKAINALGVKGLAALVICVLILMNFSKGRSFNEYMKSANWELLVVMALITVLTNSLSDQSTGILAFISNSLAPIFTGKSLIVFFILITLLPIVLTNMLNNLVIGMLFVPISFKFALDMGVNPTMLFVVLVHITSIATALPSGCATTAMLYGNTEWIKSKEALAYGIGFAFVSWIVILVLGVPFGGILF